MKLQRYELILLLMICLMVFSACSTVLTRVEPFEREYLSQDKMLFAPSPAKSAFDEHVFSIREASRGGEVSFQGGCGCR